jgi:hypothetical protein
MGLGDGRAMDVCDNDKRKGPAGASHNMVPTQKKEKTIFGLQNKQKKTKKQQLGT